MNCVQFYIVTTLSFNLLVLCTVQYVVHIRIEFPFYLVGFCCVKMSRSGHGSSGGGGGIQFSEDQINEFQEAFLLYDNRYVGFYTYVQQDCVLAGFFSPILRYQEQQNFRNLEFRREILEFSEISFHFDGGNLEFPLSLEEKSWFWVKNP